MSIVTLSADVLGLEWGDRKAWRFVCVCVCVGGGVVRRQADRLPDDTNSWYLALHPVTPTHRRSELFYGRCLCTQAKRLALTHFTLFYDCCFGNQSKRLMRRHVEIHYGC